MYPGEFRSRGVYSAKLDFSSLLWDSITLVSAGQSGICTVRRRDLKLTCFVRVLHVLYSRHFVEVTRLIYSGTPDCQRSKKVVMLLHTFSFEFNSESVCVFLNVSHIFSWKDWRDSPLPNMAKRDFSSASALRLIKHFSFKMCNLGSFIAQ